MSKLLCARCNKYIMGKAKFSTNRHKTINETDYYCEKCFYHLNMERSWNEYSAQETARKK